MMVLPQGRIEHNAVLFSILDDSPTSSIGSRLCRSPLHVEHDLERRRNTRCTAAAILIVGGLTAYMGFGRWRPLESPRSHMENTIAAQMLTIQGPVASTCGQLHKDADYEYSNLAGLGHLDNIVSSQDCCTLCLGEPTCKSFTWVKDAHLLVGNPGQCWLKGGPFVKRSEKSGVYSAFVRDAEAELAFSKDPDLNQYVAITSTEPIISEGSTKHVGITPDPVITEVSRKPGVSAETEAPTEAPTEVPKEPTEAPTETATSTSKTSTTTEIQACCSFEPFAGCGDALNISTVCDASKKYCETDCAGKWLLKGASQQPDGLDVKPPTPPPKPTPPSPRKSNEPCCSFAPLKGCGDELAISKYCDASKKRCEDDCAGKWLPGGPEDNPSGLDLYSDYLPSSDAA